MIVCIAGMHRSGTSMVARMLMECGLYLGDEEDLIPAADDNVEGFWENIKFQSVNEEILSILGGGWDIPPQYFKDWETSPPLVNLHVKAGYLVEQFSSLTETWGWKDPRNSLALPFWKKDIPNLKIVVCLRNPYEVYRSLAKRGYASSLFSYQLWLLYNQQILAHTKQEERIVTHFDSFFQNPHDELRRLVNFLEMDVLDDAIQNACKSISIGSRHSKGSMSDLRATYVPEEVLSIYRELCLEAGKVYNSLPSSVNREQSFIEKIRDEETNTGKVDDAVIAELKNSLEEVSAELRALKQDAVELHHENLHYKRVEQNLRKVIEELGLEKELYKTRLDQTLASRSWRFARAIQKIREFVAPKGSFREKFLKVMYRVLGVRLILQTIMLLYREGVNGLWRSIRYTVSAGITSLPFRKTYKSLYRDMLSSANAKQKNEYVPLSEDILVKDASVKAIAFYLPQFHPIPENDEWWGKGFVEWTNVSKALPQFVGHYQPHLPGELGFYDLRVPEVQKRQIELARQHGIYGFAFYYYWFNGKRLLEKPLDLFLQSNEDFPFCICWANENWTRRWDGQEDEVLIAQDHSHKSDLNFIKDVSPLFQNERYIRINGRPLLIVYRANIIPNITETVAIWRDYCIKQSLGDPYLVAAQTFWFADPREVGFDAALEFPPHNVLMTDISHRMRISNPQYKGFIYDYKEIVEKYSNKPRTEYKLFKTVFPSWDNEARKPGRGQTFAFSTPELYKKWLLNAVKITLQDPDPEKRLAFINAWNEWGEGTHLEPDRKYGYAHLHVTAEVLQETASRPVRGVASPLEIPIIVFQPGKVGSMSVAASLQTEFDKRNVLTPIYHAHILENIDYRIELITQLRTAPENSVKKLLESKELRQQIDNYPDQPWNVISLVRDPVAQKISAMFQLIDEYIPDWQERLESGRLALADLQKLFYEEEELGTFHGLDHWFDNQIKSIWDIDVYNVPFDKKKGFQIYERGSVHLLIIRLEDLNLVARRAFHDFVGIRDFSIISTNVGNEKPYRKLYEEFKKLPVASTYLDAAYTTRYARHFYSDQEINAFRKNWSHSDDIIKTTS